MKYPFEYFFHEIHQKLHTQFGKALSHEEFFEEDNIIRIRSVIMVERESQKGIIIGHKGGALKKIGTKARLDLEKFFGKKVFIELHVKVSKNWRSNSSQLKRFGYKQ